MLVNVSVEVLRFLDCKLAMETSGVFIKLTEPFSIQVAFGRGTPTKLQSRFSVVPTSTIISESDVELTSGESVTIQHLTPIIL